MAKDCKRIMLIGDNAQLTAHIQLTFKQAARICFSHAEMARAVIRLFRPHVLVIFADIPDAASSFNFVKSLSPDERGVIESVLLVFHPSQLRERAEARLRSDLASVRHFMEGDAELLAQLTEAINQRLQATTV